MQNIEGYAKQLCKQYGTSNPFALCEALNIEVLYCDLPRDVNGFYLLAGEAQIVFLNDGLDECEARIVCGHELGHALLHRDYNSALLSTQTLLNCQRYENEADTFCACLLIDDELCADDEVVTLENIAKQAGLPLRLVQLRQLQLKN
ncbi:MAG: ImmA/IrrE family metallo-endopeptidase [Hydrogenoanaerobacterium sp.]